MRHIVGCLRKLAMIVSKGAKGPGVAVDLELSEEQVAVKALVEDFTDREISPHAVAWDRAGSVDRGTVKKLGDVGFLGLTIPEEYGGSGGDHVRRDDPT
jgi:alkylation response protein AidB-like acyl-CoA dehydrogenase